MKNNQMKFGRLLVCFWMLSIPFGTSAFSPAADSSSVEWIKAYFNMPADYSVALPGNMSKSSQDLIGMLERLIDSADHSVDLAIYDLEHPRIGQAYAGRIIAFRETHGSFTDVEQLRKINGIGPKTMEKLRPNVVVK